MVEEEQLRIIVKEARGLNSVYDHTLNLSGKNLTPAQLGLLCKLFHEAAENDELGLSTVLSGM
jgi:hypothetical protein